MSETAEHLKIDVLQEFVFDLDQRITRLEQIIVRIDEIINHSTTEKDHEPISRTT